jgi:YVTN family beta-propeller protein
MTTPAVRSLTRRLTLPFARGADTLPLALAPGADATEALVAPYDFQEHAALFDRLPEPRYLLLAPDDVAARTVVTVDYDAPAAGGGLTPHTTDPLEIPEGTPAGSSFLLDLKADEGPLARLRTVHVLPAGGGPAAADWQLTGLLGNVAKLLWVIGAERDVIRQQLRRVAGQRFVATATSRSLDLLGSDLGVPRFPPLPYFFDEATRQFSVALYHLNDSPVPGQPEVDQVVNDLARLPGKAALPGTNVHRAAQSGVSGRFGDAFAFRGAAAVIEVDDNPVLNVGVTTSFTAECFVKPDSRPDPAPGGWHVLRKHADPEDANQKGWALSLGEFGRGLRGNARLVLSDGTPSRRLLLFADLDLPTDRFTHLAGVLDRAAGEARFYADGVLRDRKPLAGLDDLTNGEKVRIGGPPSAGFQGVIDEVRLSRAAFGSFFPVLGESDENYRRRLRLFHRWTLPTPANLVRLLNEAAGPIGGDPAALVVNDADATVLGGSLDVTVTPAPLPPGGCLDSVGDRRASEADVSGTAAAEITFDPVFLVRHNDPARVTYAAPPARVLKAGELAPDPHKMQLGLVRALNGLLDLLGPPGADRLLVQCAFDPQADDLRAVGRGVLLAHTSRPPGEVAALAHQAGFAFVCHRADLGAAYASVPPGAYVGVAVAAGGAAAMAEGFDLRLGETLDLQVEPSLPIGFGYRWLSIRCGGGRGHFTTRPDRPTVTLQADAPGDLYVKVEVIGPRRTVSATRQLHLGLVDLADGQSVGADGTLGADTTAAGEPDDFFDPAYLVTVNEPAADFGTDLNRRRMQPSLAGRLTRLLQLISQTGAPGQLSVVEAYAPGAAGLEGQGRRLALEHASPLARLGALAHAAGFSYVRRQGIRVEVRQAPEALLTVTGADTVAEGAATSLSLRPRAGPRGVAVVAGKVYTANAGTDTVSEIDPATGRVPRTFKVGWEPVAVAGSADGQRLFTADASGNTVTEVTLSSGATRTVMVGHRPVALAVHPTQPRLYVLCQGDNSLVPVDTAALTTQPAVAVGNLPTALAVTPNGQEIWIVLAQDQSARVLSTAALATLAQIALTEKPEGLALAGDGLRAYVTFPEAGRLRILDVVARTVLGQIDLGQAGPASQPGAVAVTPDGGTVLVADRGGAPPPVGQVHLLTPQAASPFVTVRARVRVRRVPAGVAADNSRAYVVNAGSDDLSVINYPPGQVSMDSTRRLGSGRGEQLTWVVRAAGGSSATTDSTTDTTVTLTGLRAGPVLVRAVYLLPDNPDPYTFEVRLKPALEQDPNLVIRKDQYDVIMNVLNSFHPAGVEVITGAIRERVIEVSEGKLSASPDYTYPAFRVRRRPLRKP